MEGVLRVVSGPNTGAVFVLGARTRLGRAVDADIQLAEAHVSRHHARIVRLEGGGFELSDLGSRDGTRVNGQAVKQRVLRPNDVIAIGHSRFSFEYCTGEVTARDFARKARGFEALRPTVPVPRLTAETASRPTVMPQRRRRRTTQKKMPAVGVATVTRRTARLSLSIDLPFVPNAPSDRAVPEPAVERPEQAPSRAAAPKTRPRSKRVVDPTPGAEAMLDAILGPGVHGVASPSVEAANEDSGDIPGSTRERTPTDPSLAVVEPKRHTAPKTIPGVPVQRVFPSSSGPIDIDPDTREAALKVLRDVLDYRALRLDELRGAELSPSAKQRFDRLSTRLLVDTHGIPASRRFVRTPCSLPATITQLDGSVSRTLEVSLADLSAGGARLSMHDPTVRVGDVVWLAIDLAALFAFGQKVVFRSRVVWTSPSLGASGLMFGGNARFAETVEAAIATA